jgi:hypothetical protein
MAITPKYENIRVDDYKALPPKQTAVECVLRAEKGSIKNVLSIKCDCQLLSCEAMAGEARISGRVDFKAIYEDDEGELDTLAYYADFNDRVEDPGITPVSRLFCQVSVADVETVSVAKDEIKLACVLECALKVNNPYEMSLLSEGEGFLCNSTSRNSCSYSGGGRESFEASDEFEEKRVIKKVLLSEAAAVITDAGAGVNSVTVEGEAVVRLNYVDDEGEVGTCQRVIPFSHEIEAKDVLPSDKAFADAQVRSLKVNAIVDEERNMTAISLSLDIEVTARAYGSECISYVDDVFSPQCKLNVTYNGINSRTYIGSYNYKQTIEGTASLDDDMMPVERILAAAGGRVYIANILPEEGKVTVEGIASATVLYAGTGNEGERRVASVGVEIPFSITLDIEGAKPGDTVELKAAIFDIETRSHRGREIEVRMQLRLRADLFSDEVITVVSDVEEGEPLAQQCSISIYMPGENEKLWDVAKQLGMPPETILEFNPDLQLPAEGVRVFVYRQKF